MWTTNAYGTFKYLHAFNLERVCIVNMVCLPEPACLKNFSFLSYDCGHLPSDWLAPSFRHTANCKILQVPLSSPFCIFLYPYRIQSVSKCMSSRTSHRTVAVVTMHFEKRFQMLPNRSKQRPFCILHLHSSDRTSSCQLVTIATSAFNTLSKSLESEVLPSKGRHDITTWMTKYDKIECSWNNGHKLDINLMPSMCKCHQMSACISDMSDMH